MTRFFEGVRAQRRAVLFAFVMLLAMGAWAGFRAPAAILPEVTFPRITVIADAGELPAEQVLRAVTRPLETSVRRVPGVRELRSTTARGSVEMNIDCTWQTPMDLTLQRVQASLDAVRGALPEGTTVDARLMSPALFPVLAWSLSSPTRSLAELRDLAVFELQPELARLPGCAEVVVQGGRRYEARVTLEPSALQARGLDAAAVASAVQRSTQLETVGLLESNRELYLGLADDRPGDLASLERVPIPLADGTRVPLGTLGRVTLAEAPEYTRYRTGGVDAVHLNLLRQRTASTVTLADAARAWFQAHRRDLPPDVQVRVIYDQSLLVRDSIAGARDALLVGVLTEVLIVMLFLGSLRLGLTYALGLPGAIAMTLIALRFAGGSLDMMTLGGIAAAIGLVADDAIVVVEYLVHRTEVPLAAGLAELMPGMLASSGCTLAIFLPFVWLGGVAGAFFRVLALTMALMLTASLILCFTVVPQFVASAPEKSADSRLARIREGIGPLFGAGARALIRRPWAALLAIGVAAGLAATLSLSLGTGFLPEMDEGSLIFDYFMPPGTSPSETEKVLAGIEREMAATPEVAMYSGRIGDQLGFFITEPSRGDYVLVLKARRKRTGEEVAADLRERIATQWPMVRIEFGQLVEDNIGDLIAVPQPVEVKLFGEDRLLLEQRARQVAVLLSGIRGVVDIDPGVVVGGPNLTFTPTTEGRRLGLDAGALADAVRPVIAGIDAGEIVRGARAWPVRVTLPREADIASELRALMVPVAPGRTRPLAEVATVHADTGEAEIDRDDLRTSVSITARLEGRDMGSAMREVQRVLAERLPLPPGMSLRYAGLYAEQQASFMQLLLVLLGAVAAVTLILLLAFHTWRATLAVMAVTLASLAGVFAALRLTGATFNLSSFVGAIVLVGIVAENATFVVLAYMESLKRGLTPAVAAEAAATRRARPVLMTTLAGIGALLPLAFGFGAGSALLKPLAVAVV
ncbi:MAG TPA: efflux RND transporter permease subunit, partial [Gemmatimonadaceae bacterium]|nr:efflux RND transporter permease subunit [Gemmatimonadaceae bacterium]